MTEITVVMPVFNSEKFLEAAVHSVLLQNFSDWELIIIDDRSTDNSSQYIKSFSKEDSRIRYLRNKKRIGCVKSIEKSFKIAKGDYITFLDADDLMSPKRIAEQLRFMKKNKLDLSYCDLEMFFENGDRVIKKSIDFSKKFKSIMKSFIGKKFDLQVPPGYHLGYQKHKRTIYRATFMFKKDILKKVKFDINCKLMEENDLFFQAIAKNLRIKRFPKPYYQYRRHEFQATKNLDAISKYEIYISKKLKSGAYFK